MTVHLIVKDVFLSKFLPEDTDLLHKLLDDNFILFDFLALGFILLFALENVIVHVVNFILEIFNLLHVQFVYLS